MSLETINYKFNGIDEARNLTTILELKFSSLEKFTTQAKSVFCEVEFEKMSPQQHGRIFRLETNLTIDGTLYRAEATEESFEKAIDEVRDELDKELRRAKDKQVTLEKAAGREIKEQMYDA